MKLGIVIASSFTLFLIGSARADLIPPEVGACQNKQVGDACVSNGTGVCQAQTCTRLDYANWNRDASSSPPSTSYACNKCVTTTSTGTNTSTTPTATATNSATATVTNTATATPTQTATTTGTATPTSTGTGTIPFVPTTTSTGTNTANLTDTSSTTNSNVLTAPPTTTSTNTNTKSNDGDSPSNDDGSCSVGKQITAKRIAPWLLASAFSLLFLFGRRRRR